MDYLRVTLLFFWSKVLFGCDVAEWYLPSNMGNGLLPSSIGTVVMKPAGKEGVVETPPSKVQVLRQSPSTFANSAIV
jgi:hypothetical protein